MTPDTLAIELFCRLASLSNSLSRASISSSSSLSCGRAIPADLARHRPNHTARMQCDSLPLSRESGAPMGSTHTHATGTQTSRQVHSLRGCSSELATSDARAWRGLGEQRRRGSVDLMRGSEAANNNDHDAAAARGRGMTSADLTSRISIGIQTSWMVGQPSHPDTPDRDRHALICLDARGQADSLGGPQRPQRPHSRHSLAAAVARTTLSLSRSPPAP